MILDDLSQTGAQITLSDKEVSSSGVLTWLHFEAFADLAWHEGTACGFRFEQPLSEECLLETRSQAPGMLDLQSRLRKMAKNWSEGAPDW